MTFNVQTTAQGCRDVTQHYVRLVHFKTQWSSPITKLNLLCVSQWEWCSSFLLLWWAGEDVASSCSIGTQLSCCHRTLKWVGYVCLAGFKQSQVLFSWPLQVYITEQVTSVLAASRLSQHIDAPCLSHNPIVFYWHIQWFRCFHLLCQFIL